MSDIQNPFEPGTQVALLFEHYAEAYRTHDAVYQPYMRLRMEREDAYRPRMGHTQGAGWSEAKAAELARLEAESQELQRDVNAVADRLIALTGRPVPIVS